ncbi:MAG TPA: hypothetical protein PKM57_08705 [Kiritimatiellia bacterium]|nr:hypothetical protein [Kiritimatiellia bacterium]HPS07921.1 hypothetical protein [Kiritimatiellia bacterium]
MISTDAQPFPDDSEKHGRFLREIAAFEELCLAVKNSRHPGTDIRRALDRVKASLGANHPFAPVLDQASDLFIKARQALTSERGARFKRAPLERRFTFRTGNKVLILAGSTDAQSGTRLAAYEAPLQDALSTYKGYLITGGTGAGVCGLAARCAAHANASGKAHVELVGYLPAHAEASFDFPHIVRTVGSDFSLLEPLQMWNDLFVSGIPPSAVTLLCLGGGVVSAQELALAWALGARVAATDGDELAPKRFAALVANAGPNDGRGIILPDDPASLREFVTFIQPSDVLRSGSNSERAEEHDYE